MLIKITHNDSRYEHGPRWRQRQPFGSQILGLLYFRYYTLDKKNENKINSIQLKLIKVNDVT